jgi:hypothetical protein
VAGTGSVSCPVTDFLKIKSKVFFAHAMKTYGETIIASCVLTLGTRCR